MLLLVSLTTRMGGFIVEKVVTDGSHRSERMKKKSYFEEGKKSVRVYHCKERRACCGRNNIITQDFIILSQKSTNAVVIKLVI